MRREKPLGLSYYTRTAKDPRIRKENETNRRREQHIKKGFGSLNVRLPKHFPLVEKLKKSHAVTRLCQVFGIHRSSYQYWVKGVNRIKPEQIE